MLLPRIMSDWETSKSPKNEKIKKGSDKTIARGEKVSSETFKNVIEFYKPVIKTTRKLLVWFTKRKN